MRGKAIITNGKFLGNLASLFALTFVVLTTTGCKSTEKRLQGEWKVTNVYIDGKEILEIKENYDTWFCGRATDIAKYQMDNGSILFDESGRYRAMIVYILKETVEYQFCNSDNYDEYSATSDEGRWRLIGKDRLEIYTPAYDKTYECTIERLKKKELRLRCPCWKDCSIDLLEDGDVDYTIKEVEIVAVKQ